MLLYQSFNESDREKRERYNVCCYQSAFAMTGALAWQVKTTLNKIFYFLGFGGETAQPLFLFWAFGPGSSLACVLFSLSLSLKLSKKSQKAQNLLVLPNAQKTSIHYPIQTSVARIAAPYAAHQKGSLTQKVNCKFARFNFQLLQPKHCPLNFLF